MLQRGVVNGLAALNVAAALVLAVVALHRLTREGVIVPLLLLIGLLIVGPVEDLLKRHLVGVPVDPGPVTAQIIDRATSLALILILIAAGLLAR